MIDILFFAQNRHQYNYFKKLQQNLPFNIKVIHSVRFCYEFTNLNIDKKIKEIELKYSPLKAKLYILYIKFITPIFYCSYKFYINKYNPKIVGVWNGIKYPQNFAVEIAKKQNKKVIYFENGFLPNTTQVDCKGVNAYNSVIKNIEYYQNLNLTFIPPKRLEKREFVGKQKITEVNLPKDYIFVPFQVGYDSQIIYFSDIKDMRELFFLIKDIAEKLKINFVFKEHPSDKTNDYSDLHKIAQNSKYITFANKVETEKLIKKSSSVITINSSIGIESLIFHKKVYVLGEAFYRIEGITIPCNKNNLFDKLTSDIEIDFNLVDKFLAYLQNVYLVKGNWRNADKEHFKNIEKKVLECLQ